MVWCRLRVVTVVCCSSAVVPAEDQEDTIDAQEKVEGNVDHAEELDDLAKEGRAVLLF